MGVEIITKDDLDAFRIMLLNDIKALIIPEKAPATEWLRCGDVRKMLKISTATLQNLRVSRKLKSRKIGGIHFYKLSDIESMLEGKS